MTNRLPDLFSFLLLFFVVCACSMASTTSLDYNDRPLESNLRVVIPLEDALNRLTVFLSETDMALTKAGEKRYYSSVQVHYSDYPATKNGEPLPDAYLVNFDNDKGFAILGANTGISPIIAVVENGNTDWNKLLPEHEDCSFNNNWSGDPSHDELELLGPGMSPEQILTSCVIGALYGDNSADAVRTKSGPYTINITPLLGYNYQFGQNVTYCHKGGHRFVTNGCASTAISMIVAYNNYPHMTVDLSTLNYSYCDIADGVGYYFLFSDDNISLLTSDYFTNSSLIPSSLTQAQKLNLLTKIDSHVISDHGTPTVTDSSPFFRTRYKLTSGIYYTLSNIIKNWNGTGTLPSAAVNGLEDLGYTGVSKKQTSYMSSEQISTIINMLSNNKPVLMCGWTLLHLDESHYWVVDGIRQNDDETLLCCNWGHKGTYDGWFNSNCLRPKKRVATKNAITKSQDPSNDWEYLIVFSYNMSSSTPSVSVRDFYDQHRATY